MTVRRIGRTVAVAAVVLLLSAGAPRMRPPAAADPADATVTVYGRDGTFGAVADAVPSGQPVARRPRPART